MKDLIFLVDFDRTITMNDSTDELMNQFNPQMVEDYQKKFRRKEIRVRDYIKGLLESLKINKEQYKDAVTKNLIIDENFKNFLKLGYEIRVVSAGTYENILPNFEKEGIQIPLEHIYSNKLEFTNEGIKLTFPYDKDDCDEEELFFITYKEDEELLDKVKDFLRTEKEDLEMRGFIGNELEEENSYRETDIDFKIIGLCYDDVSSLKDEIYETIEWNYSTISIEFLKAYKKAIDSKFKIREDLKIEVEKYSQFEESTHNIYNHLALLKRLEKRILNQ